MQIRFGKSMWECLDWPMERFLDAVAAEGFDAVELHAAALKDPPESTAELARARGIERLMLLPTFGPDFAAQLDTLEQGFAAALAYEPTMVTCHAGADFLRFDENLKIIERSLELGRDAGVAVVHETHRGRPLYSVPETLRYLEALPALRLNADFSHWMAVHESDLEAFEDRLPAVIERCDYIHARVGYSEGPQVTDPRAPEARPWLVRHQGLWKRILDAATARGRETFFITPEFGPAPYAHTLPYVDRAIADIWNVNVFMKRQLEEIFVRERD